MLRSTPIQLYSVKKAEKDKIGETLQETETLPMKFSIGEKSLDCQQVNINGIFFGRPLHAGPQPTASCASPRVLS